jgi:hypothetical protein
MAKYPCIPTVINGNLEISKSRTGVLIGGDPNGLRSIAKLLVFLADANQALHPNMPDGEREHTHLYCGPHLTQFSVETEICRLDAKGTGDFPERYLKKSRNKPRRTKGRKT